MREAAALILWTALVVAFAWIVFGWQVGAGVALMVAAVGLADLLWSRLTGATVSEWFWRKKTGREAAIFIFTGALALGLILHLLGR